MNTYSQRLPYKYNILEQEGSAIPTAQVNPHNINSAANITLSYFSAEIKTDQQHKALLKWATGQEINANYFSIQRSGDGIQFDDAAIVFAQEGNSKSERVYYYKDDLDNLNGSSVYYRLKSVDMNGNISYSDMQLLRIATTGNYLTGISVYPNTQQTELRFSIPQDWQGKSLAFDLYNTHGNLLKEKTAADAGQTELLNISDVPVGIYLVKAVNGNETYSQKIVKLTN